MLDRLGPYLVAYVQAVRELELEDGDPPEARRPPLLELHERVGLRRVLRLVRADVTSPVRRRALTVVDRPDREGLADGDLRRPRRLPDLLPGVEPASALRVLLGERHRDRLADARVRRVDDDERPPVLQRRPERLLHQVDEGRAPAVRVLLELRVVVLVRERTWRVRVVRVRRRLDGERLDEDVGDELVDDLREERDVRSDLRPLLELLDALTLELNEVLARLLLDLETPDVEVLDLLEQLCVVRVVPLSEYPVRDGVSLGARRQVLDEHLRHRRRYREVVRRDGLLVGQRGLSSPRARQGKLVRNDHTHVGEEERRSEPLLEVLLESLNELVSRHSRHPVDDGLTLQGLTALEDGARPGATALYLAPRPVDLPVLDRHLRRRREQTGDAREARRLLELDRLTALVPDDRVEQDAHRLVARLERQHAPTRLEVDLRPR